MASPSPSPSSSFTTTKEALASKLASIKKKGLSFVKKIDSNDDDTDEFNDGTSPSVSSVRILFILCNSTMCHTYTGDIVFL